MHEIELVIPPDADLTDAEHLIEAVCAAEGLRLSALGLPAGAPAQHAGDYAMAESYLVQDKGRAESRKRKRFNFTR